MCLKALSRTLQRGQGWEIQEIREIISKINNYDDIGMNFLAR